MSENIETRLLREFTAKWEDDRRTRPGSSHLPEMQPAENPHAAYLAYMRDFRDRLRASSAALKQQGAAEAKARKRKTKPATREPAAGGVPKPHWAAKITPDDVRVIRRRHAAGENRNALASEFGLTARSINLIASRRRWARVPD